MTKSQYSLRIFLVAFSFAATFVQPATATGDKLNTEAATLSDFVGYYSVNEKCPKYDFNTAMLHISLEHISMTETGCEIVSVETQDDARSIILELNQCHAEGVPSPDERALLVLKEGIKTLQYLPNNHGFRHGDGRVFNLKECPWPPEEN